MISWLNELGSDKFLPHGQCYLWDPGIVWLHAISDITIAVAYFSIPVALVYFVRRRRDLPFAKIFLMFGAFIISCGITHAISAWEIWEPHYWLSGGAKAFTALISIATVIMLVKIMPAALKLPSPSDLQRLNESLDHRVAERTAELSDTNEKLSAAISEREAAEAEVRRLNERLQDRIDELQTLFDLIPVGVAISNDADCTDIRCNHACSRLLGQPVGANISLSVAPDARPSTMRILVDGVELTASELPMQRATRENRALHNFEERLVRDDGSYVDVLVDVVPLRNRDGEATGCVATFQDLTLRKEAEFNRLEFERKFQATQKLESLGVLAGGIAHDFNNLLTGILGYASLTRHFIAPSENRVRDAIEHIEIAANRAADLCKQLLAYAGKGRFEERALQIEAVVQDTVSLFEVSISKRASLQINQADNLPAIKADEVQLRQVLMNLVINASEAIAATRPHGFIRINIEAHNFAAEDLKRLALRTNLPAGTYVVLEVTDDGCGMSSEVQERIFEPFYTTKFTGRGLGLSAVIGIVHGHRGGIKVYSEPGRGTTFKLLFPALESASLSALKRDSNPPLGWTTIGRALVVDDEESVRTLARDALQLLGLEVTCANDGLEGLACIDREAPFDLILLDLTMPRCGGDEVVRKLRQRDQPPPPIIIMSGFSEHAAAGRFFGRGVIGFLAKPFSFEHVAKLVRKALEG